MNNTHTFNQLRGGGALLVDRSNVALRAEIYWRNHNSDFSAHLLTSYVLLMHFDFTIEELSKTFLVSPRTCRRWIESACFYVKKSEAFRLDAQKVLDYLLHNYKYIPYGQHEITNRRVQ